MNRLHYLITIVEKFVQNLSSAEVDGKPKKRGNYMYGRRTTYDGRRQMPTHTKGYLRDLGDLKYLAGTHLATFKNGVGVPLN